MLLNGESHVQGIFKYSDDIEFEKDDFVVEGNCIYICTSAEPVKRKRPSKNPDYYTAYPGEKITSAEEYYNYLDTRENGEDKYVSAYALCDILENMYFGFGDNGLITDHVIYNPAEGIDYSIRSVKEILNSYTPDILNRILQTEDLNNGYVKISRNIKEISDILQEDYNSETFESNVVILRQYTYLDSSKDNTKFRVQELIDPEKNRIYFRFAKGEVIDDTTYFNSASPWKNIYSNDEDTRNKLNTVEDYYRTKTLEIQDLYNRLKGKYCYRNVEISNPSSVISLIPGGTKDIKSIESFATKSCFLDVIIKSPVDGAENLYKNYSITIDTKDIVEAFNNTESYQLSDGIVLTGLYYRDGNGYETIGLTVSPSTCVIKDIYYRDYTLGHIHNWRLTNTITPPTCTQEGWGEYSCEFCDEVREDVIDRLKHEMVMHPEVRPTCTEPGNHLYYTCNNEHDVYYKDEEGIALFTGYFDGDDPVFWEIESNNHNFTEWYVRLNPTCTENGIKERKCTICGYSEEQEIPSAGGHDLVENPRVEPTCGEYGNERYWNCEICGKMFADSQATTEVTENDLRLLPTGDHNIDEHNDNSDIIIITPATYTDDNNPHKGLGMIQCPDCHNYIEVELDYKKHNIDQNHIDTHEIYEYHPATCTTDAYEEGWCLDCGARRINYNFGTALGHTVNQETSNYIRSTCTEGGYWKGDVCTVCGARDVFQYNPNDLATGHTLNTSNHSTVYRPSSCNRSAYWMGTCTVCNADHISLDDNSHKPIGHKDVDENSVCDVCGTRIGTNRNTTQ